MKNTKFNLKKKQKIDNIETSNEKVEFIIPSSDKLPKESTIESSEAKQTLPQQNKDELDSKKRKIPTTSATKLKHITLSRPLMRKARGNPGRKRGEVKKGQSLFHFEPAETWIYSESMEQITLQQEQNTKPTPTQTPTLTTNPTTQSPRAMPGMGMAFNPLEAKNRLKKTPKKEG